MATGLPIPAIRYSPENAVLAEITAALSESAKATDWLVEPGDTPLRFWIDVRHASAHMPPQGWKLHVSATACSALPVLRATLPVLFSIRTNFKVAASLEILDFLNQGAGGLSQIGKFITVYPADEQAAVKIAAALDQATLGERLRGPEIPSDRPLRLGSIVYYRFGNFDGRPMRTLLGETLPALRAPDGGLVPDRRGTAYAEPGWAADPFLTAGIATELPERPLLIGKRFLIVSQIHTSPRGRVFLATDILEGRTCILKEARPNAVAGWDGRDARDRLRHEFDILTLLEPDRQFPTVYGLFEDDNSLFLAVEDIPGETLEQRVNSLLGQGILLPLDQVKSWGLDLADTLQALHARDIVYRDLKSSNVIVGRDGRLRLVDFEVAHKLGSRDAPFAGGTRGYASPQQSAGMSPTVSDDVYGLGALLYFLATSAEPSLAPHPDRLLARPVTLLDPSKGSEIETVIARCLDPDLRTRLGSAAKVAATIASLCPARARAEPMLDHKDPQPERRQVQAECRSLARRLTDSLCATARPAPAGKGVIWVSHYQAGAETAAGDLNAGNAGVVLALAELVAGLGDPKHRRTLADGAQHLASSRPLLGPFLPGLYIGEAGVSLALLRAGQALDNPDMIAAAIERATAVAAAPYRSPDLFHGTAGRLRLHLALWNVTAAPSQIEAAKAAGHALLNAAEDLGARGLRWRIPDGYDDLSGRACLGYAHGAAGIGDAILDLFEATGDPRFLEAAQRAGRWLMGLCSPALADESGLNWPDIEGEQATGAFWCRGAGGIARFLIHACAVGALPDALSFAERCARTVARGMRAVSATQCHGLAGSIELLIDMYQATGDAVYLDEAASLVTILQTFADEQDGNLVWRSEDPAIVSPDLMLGYSGVAVCMLRLALADERPHLLSVAATGTEKFTRVLERVQATAETGALDLLWDMPRSRAWRRSSSH